MVFEENKAWDWNANSEGKDEQPVTFVVVNEQREEEDVPTGSELEGTGSDDDSQTSPGSQASPQVSSMTQSHRVTFSPGSSLNPDNYDGSSEPKKFRHITELYENTEELDGEEELLFLGCEEPCSFKQAAKDKSWKQAMVREMESIEKNGTWRLTDPPVDQKVIGLKWIFKLKKDADGRIVKHKARLVAKGYVQEYGVDFEEVFAPVTRIETVRLLLALAAKNDWVIHHLDVKTAFLNGEINEDVYVVQPEGFEKPGQEQKVYKLLKALYGLRQAPRAWYAKLNSCLADLGFTRFPSEHAVYTRKEGEEGLVIAVYVDDLLITGSSKEMIERFKNEMSQKFEMTDLGKLSYYLGMEVEQGKGYIEIKQAGYAKKILERAGMAECNPTKYPMDPKEQISKNEGGQAVDSTMYKSLVGGL